MTTIELSKLFNDKNKPVGLTAMTGPGSGTF